MKLRMLVTASAVALTLAACSDSPPDNKEPGPDLEKGTSQKLVEISPLTGKALRKGRPSHPVFVVKVENTDGGAPQYGLDKADLVIEELVEGGLTRLAAMYYSELPSKVGHVRSIRSTDIGIASPVGAQIVASGGAAGTYKRVQSAGITVFSEDAGAPGFSSDPSKVRPYNRLVNLKTVAGKARRSKVFGPYLPWTPRAPKKTAGPSGTASAMPTPPPSKKATSAAVAFSRSTRTQWELTDQTWRRTNGYAAPGQDFAADTLVVMFCKVGDAGYLDPAGNPVPETDLKGSGRVVLLHGRRATEGRWTKASKRSTITFKAKNGSPLTVDPGNVFIELVPKGAGSISLR